MTDLEVLCRECHEAHHRVERAAARKERSGLVALDRQAAYRYLTVHHRNQLRQEFLISEAELFTHLTSGASHEMEKQVCRLLGVDCLSGRAVTTKAPARKKPPEKDRNELEREAVSLGGRYLNIIRMHTKHLKEFIHIKRNPVKHHTQYTPASEG